jgi:hypothetical protein
LSTQQNSLANENWTDIKVVKVFFNIITTRTPWTIWQVWQELVLIQVTCLVSKLTMEYVVFSCTQGKIGGGTDILDLICFLNISLQCWFCVSTSSKFQLSITLGENYICMKWYYTMEVQKQGMVKRVLFMRQQHCGTRTSDFKKKLLTCWWNYYHSLKFIWTIEPNSKQSEVLCDFFYSVILQKIKISMLVFNAIKFTYLFLDKTFPVKT